jgi:hypothetical protein
VIEKVARAMRPLSEQSAGVTVTPPGGAPPVAAQAPPAAAPAATAQEVPVAPGPAPQLAPAQQPAPRQQSAQEYVLGGAGTKPSSEGLQKSALYSSIMSGPRQSMEAAIGYNDQTGVPPQFYVPGSTAGTLNRLGGESELMQGFIKSTVDPKAVQYFNDARAFVEAPLRMVSGAVIAPSEVSRWMSIFIPNSADDAQSVGVKIQRMRVLEDAVRNSATVGGAIQMLQHRGLDVAAESLYRRASEPGGLGLNAPVPQETKAAISQIAPAVVAPVAPAAAQAAPAAPGRGRVHDPDFLNIIGGQ